MHELFAARFYGSMEEFKPLIFLDFASAKTGGLQARGGAGSAADTEMRCHLK